LWFKFKNMKTNDKFLDETEKQSCKSDVSGCYDGTQTPIERLRNKLTPFLTLIDLLESNEDMVLPFIDDDFKNEIFEQCLDTCIKYKNDIKINLSDCEFFYNNR
jgi:hypothetical protein